jgi:hypothetical protein
MDRLTRNAALTSLALVLLAVSCGPEKPQPVPVPVPVTTQGALFPKPYFPSHDLQIEGRPLADFASDWKDATVYTEAQLNEAQKAWVATLEPAGGEGKVAEGFTGDFDADGVEERVSYGAYTKVGGGEGNFVLVTRKAEGKPEVLLLKELPGPPQFTVFTLKPDGSLWFGGGIDAGEVTMRIVWENHLPVFSLLTQD